jgi:hypothetical protein
MIYNYMLKFLCVLSFAWHACVFFYKVDLHDAIQKFHPVSVYHNVIFSWGYCIARFPYKLWFER